jgi:hypothetical protein
VPKPHRLVVELDVYVPADDSTPTREGALRFLQEMQTKIRHHGMWSASPIPGVRLTLDDHYVGHATVRRVR